MANVVFVVATAILALSAVSQAAEQYPARPVRLVIGFPAGGPTDAAGRIIGQALSQTWGQQVVIDNRPGADGGIAPELVAKAVPDGYTVLLGTSGNMALLPAMRKAPPYDPVADFVPITFVAWTSSLLVVHPAVPARTIAELMDHARANPGKLNVAAANPGTIVVMARLNSIAKVDMVNVTYKGDVGAMPDLLSGRVHVLTGGTNLLLPYVKEGRLRALATLSRTRARPAPDVPTMAEAGVAGFSLFGWVALFGPARLPKPIVDRLSHEVNAVLKRQDIQAQFEKIGLEVGGPTQGELAAFIKEQVVARVAAVREAGMPPQ